MFQEVLQTQENILYDQNIIIHLCLTLLNVLQAYSLFSSLPQPRIQDDSLTYAELELVRPRPEPPASSVTDPTPSSPDTVYAQILFQEKQL